MNPENEKQNEEIKENTESTEKTGAETTADKVSEENKEEKASPETKEKPGFKNKKEEAKHKAEIAKLEDRISKLEGELETEKDKYLHVIAEYDNFRKRSSREKDSAYADAYEDLLKQILPIFDNMRRSLDFSDSGNLAKGIEMILKQFEDMLGKLGIEQFGQEGDAFDPALHNAVMHIDDESLGENVIAQVLEKGYKKGNKIIRFAIVKVAN